MPDSRSLSGRSEWTIERAVREATIAHEGQTDKQGEPYILHPLRVMVAVLPLSRRVAVLHDTLEDTDISPTDIALGLPEDELEALDALTRKGEPYRDYIQRIAELDGRAGIIARDVKRADLADNLNRMPLRMTDEWKRLHARYEQAWLQLKAADLARGA